MEWYFTAALYVKSPFLSSVSFVFLFTYENSDETGLNYSFYTYLDDIKSSSVIMFKLLPRGFFF
jgi:hypothetical protein